MMARPGRHKRIEAIYPLHTLAGLPKAQAGHMDNLGSFGVVCRAFLTGPAVNNIIYFLCLHGR